MSQQFLSPVYQYDNNTEGNSSNGKYWTLTSSSFFNDNVATTILYNISNHHYFFVVHFSLLSFAATPTLMFAHAHLCSLITQSIMYASSGKVEALLLAASVSFHSPAMLNPSRNSDRNKSSTRYKAIIQLWRLSIANQGKSIKTHVNLRIFVPFCWQSFECCFATFIPALIHTHNYLWFILIVISTVVKYQSGICCKCFLARIPNTERIKNKSDYQKSQFVARYFGHAVTIMWKWLQRDL